MQDSFVSVHLARLRVLARYELHGFARQLVSERFGRHANRRRHIRADTKSEVVRCQLRSWNDRWRLPQPRDNLRASHRQALPGSDIKGNSLPPPGIDVESE